MGLWCEESIVGLVCADIGDGNSRQSLHYLQMFTSPSNHSPFIVALRQLSFQGFCPEASTFWEVMEQDVLACCSDGGTQLALVLAP